MFTMITSSADMTTALAIWGAVVSTIALTWNILRDYKDRPKIRVTAAFGFTVGGLGPSIDLLTVEAVNIGRRPVELVEVACVTDEMPKGDRAIFLTLRKLPCVVNEGQHVKEFIERSMMPRGRLLSIYMKDATGRKWRASRRNMRNMNP